MSQNSEIARARRYHDATKHSWASLRRGPRGLDWDNMPLPYKIYPDLAPLPLPEQWEESRRPALEVLTSGPTTASKGSELDRSALARLLYYSDGVLRTRRYPGGEEVAFRAAACTGNLHHIDLYPVCSALADLEAGAYHFGPHDFSLRQLRSGDVRAALLEATGNCPAVADAPVSIVLASTFWRNAWKYGARAYRHCYWDSGTILANLFAVAAAAGIPSTLVLGFVDSAVAQLLGLDPRREAPLSIVALGTGAAAPPAPPVLQPLRLRTVPLSRREVEYPEMREMHDASSLATPAEVAAWRDAARTAPAKEAAGGGTAIPLAPLPAARDEPIEAVIRRRGSTRRFARTPIGFDVLSAILRAAAGDLQADFQPPASHGTEIYAAIHAVAGIEPGAYWFDRRRDALVLLRRGNFRREAGALALGQDLGADAAADLFWLCDLDGALRALGNRGYRAAQLEAAIGGGRTYLAAFALGVGATGLTFFDDDVTEFFAPHAEGKSAMFLMAVGHPHRARAAA